MAAIRSVLVSQRGEKPVLFWAFPASVAPVSRAAVSSAAQTA